MNSIKPLSFGLEIGVYVLTTDSPSSVSNLAKIDDAVGNPAI